MQKILIIDDSPVARKILKSCIPKDEPMELFEEGDGISGLQRFETIYPDITITDLTMPEMNGMEVLEKIKKSYPDAIVIVSSADVQPITKERVMSLGAFAFLKKPPSKEAVAKLFADLAQYRKQK
ncbi:MAG: response regulator [Pseudomonadota bacterium]